MLNTFQVNLVSSNTFLIATADKDTDAEQGEGFGNTRNDTNAILKGHECKKEEGEAEQPVQECPILMESFELSDLPDHLPDHLPNLPDEGKAGKTNKEQDNNYLYSEESDSGIYENEDSDNDNSNDTQSSIKMSWFKMDLEISRRRI